MKLLNQRSRGIAITSLLIAALTLLIYALGTFAPLQLIGADDSDEALLVYDDSTPYYVANLQTHIELTKTEYQIGEIPELKNSWLVLVNSGSTYDYATGWVVTIEDFDFIWQRNGAIINQLNWQSQNTPISVYDLTLPLITGNEQFPDPSQLQIGDHIEVTLALRLSIIANEGIKPTTEYFTAHYGAEMIGNQIPTVSASAEPDEGNGPLDVTLTGTSDDPDGAIVHIEWDFGDNSPIVENREVIMHTYTGEGTYIATFTATDDNGATASASVLITVNVLGANIPPSCTAIADIKEGDLPLTVRFTGEREDPDGTIVAEAWDFGDGFTSTEQSPTHQYTDVGIFSAIYTVTDNEGAVASDSETIIVTEPFVPDPIDPPVDPTPTDEIPVDVIVLIIFVIPFTILMLGVKFGKLPIRVIIVVIVDGTIAIYILFFSGVM